MPFENEPAGSVILLEISATEGDGRFLNLISYQEQRYQQMTAILCQHRQLFL